MAADVDFSKSPPIGEPQVLFTTNRPRSGTYIYDVMPNGNFVIIEVMEEENQPPRRRSIHVIENWRASLVDEVGR